MALIDIKSNWEKGSKELMKELGITNVMALPKLKSVSINVGLSNNRQNKDMVSYIAASLAKVTGQTAAATVAKKAISSFKLRAGEQVGLRVTLRGDKMYDFINRLLNVSLPRIRDFRGINPKSFDAQGNFTMGFKDQVAFVELGHEGLDKPFGVEITLSIKNSNPAHSEALLKALGFPMKTS